MVLKEEAVTLLQRVLRANTVNPQLEGTDHTTGSCAQRATAYPSLHQDQFYALVAAVCPATVRAVNTRSSRRPKAHLHR